MKWLGLDIGGANLKLADGFGYAESVAFKMWDTPDRLTQQLRTLVAQAPAASHLAVTMTAELADCFRDKAEGVKYILDAVESAADNRHTRVYLTNGMMVTPQVAMRRPEEAAAANWHALAQFVARLVPEQKSLLIDIGSTTTDIVPIVDGKPAPEGLTDTERLLARELVYAGVERTPVCGLVSSVPYRGQTCPVARELFATTRDVYTILGDLHEDQTATETADGAPATKSAARVRLGRMVCADSASFNHRDAVEIAKSVATGQAELLTDALNDGFKMREWTPKKVIVSGQGEFLAQRVLKSLDQSFKVIPISQAISSGVSRSAAAHALAVLATEAAES